MKILLVGNYPFDGATSMHIWAGALERELRAMGFEVRLVAPRPVLGRLKPAERGLGKWLGYIDRFLFFPPRLRAAAAGADIVHICDHGGAMYCGMLNGAPTLVTCHDMLAVRGAMGELPEMRASPLGRYLQRWICSGLRDATLVACVSQSTRDDVGRILGRQDRVHIVRNGLNYPFQPISRQEAGQRLAGVRGLTEPFLLHIGSNHARKNRDGVLRVFARVAGQTGMQLVFAGEALNPRLIALAGELGVLGQIVQVVKPQVSVIEALYNRAAALLFPSRCEGFGWPPIEAQACGCPVVASDIPPFAETLHGSAPLHPLEDEAGMAASILKILEDGKYRDCLRKQGLENIRSRFQTSRMMDEYVALYRELAPRGRV